MELSHNLNKMPKREMYISIDVMENILKRLPSTSIAKFQIISKYWGAVIRSLISNAQSKSSLINVQISIPIDSGKLAHFNFDEEGKTIKSIHKLNLGGTLNYNLSNMVKGLACAYGNKTTTNFYLVNLTTFKTLKYTKRQINGTAIDYDKITLGFDPSTGSYKFIRIYSHYNSYFYHCEILEVGLLSEGRWNGIGKIPYRVDLENPVFFNGAIHWMMKPQSSNAGELLSTDFLKLDMKENKFEKVAPILQNELDIRDYQVCECIFGFSLSEENGKLYMLHCCCDRKYLYGWRLKENKGDSVWNVAFYVNLESMAEKEPAAGCLVGTLEYPYVVGIVDGKVLVRSEMFNKGVYIYDMLYNKLSKHWDIDCRLYPADTRKRRMFFLPK